MIENRDLFVMHYPYGGKGKNRPHIVREITSNKKYLVKVQTWKPMYRSIKGLKYIRQEECEEPYPFKTPSCIDTSKLLYMEDIIIQNPQIINNLKDYKFINNILNQMKGYEKIKLDKETLLRTNASMVCGLSNHNHFQDN